jgi:hypothetical protein
VTIGTSAIVDRTALYRFFDSAGALLYVGITASPSTRFTLHSKKSPWWKYVDHARTAVEYHETRILAAAAELAAIKSEGPKWNIAGVSGMGGRPATVLTEEQELLLGQADEAVRQARAAEEEMWAGVVAARKGGIPDLIICQATGISRATLNRRFGNRKASGDE